MANKSMILDDEPDLSASVETRESYLAELRERPDFMLKKQWIRSAERMIEQKKQIAAEKAKE
jgi:hypothetical protein